MSVVGISMVKDERDVVEHVMRHMLDEVDRVLVADNGSTDGTREVLDELAAQDSRLAVVDDPEVGYYQSVKMSALAARAHERWTAEWVVPFDADEWWRSDFGRVGDVLRSVPERESVVRARLLDHVVTDADGDESNPFERIKWRRTQEARLPKVACRPVMQVRIHQGNHGADFGEPAPHPLLEVRHFPYRSVEQMVSKARNGAKAYAATDLPPDAGKHWRDYGALLEGGGPAAIDEVFHTWFYARDPSRHASLIYDPAT